MNDKHAIFVKLDVDGMPADVALDNLINPTQNLSSSFKRSCMAARQTYWVSDHQAKPESERLSSRMKRTPMQRLLRIFTRTNRRLKHFINVIQKMPEGPLRNNFIGFYVTPVVSLKLAASVEINRRAKIIAELQAAKTTKTTKTT